MADDVRINLAIESVIPTDKLLALEYGAADQLKFHSTSQASDYSAASVLLRRSLARLASTGLRNAPV
jgi:hypothetical protein